MQHIPEIPPHGAAAADRTLLAVSAGAHHACALLRGGATACWGLNDGGRLGAGSAITAVGNLPGQMGAALQPVDLGPGPAPPRPPPLNPTRQLC